MRLVVVLPSASTSLLLLCLLSGAAEGWIFSSQPKTHHQKGLLSSSSSSTKLYMNNNVVLQPSHDDVTAFDSYKIGNPRVHRYKRDDIDDNNVDVDSETEYVMWYHGRSHEMDQDPSLPPISTGRIGRATSRNGLHWIKDTKGSASEDIEGVSLGINKESWWGFDTAHVGLGNVLLPMSTPAVMTEGGVYLMYFMGGNQEETPVQDYIENSEDKLPESMKDASIKGMKMKIGVALSQDGITWGRVEGDDHTGAVVVPYDKSCPNQQANAKSAGRTDSTTIIPDGYEEELYCAWPDVVVNLNGKDDDDDKFLMYYSTMSKSTKQKCIAYAGSDEGFRWEKRGVCLEPDSEGPDAGGCARCCVVKDATYDKTTMTWTECETGWTMYYEGVSLIDNKHRIMVATSNDHKTWIKGGVVLDVGDSDIGGEESEAAWDAGGVGSPHILRMDDGSMRMYYTGQGLDGSTAIGVAKNDASAGGWVREQATFTFADVAD